MNTCPHELDPMQMVCIHCGLTAEDIRREMDKPATWEDVNEAYKDGYNLGIEIGAADYKLKRRTKLIEVGYYLCLRQLGQSIEKREK